MNRGPWRRLMAMGLRKLDGRRNGGMGKSYCDITDKPWMLLLGTTSGDRHLHLESGHLFVKKHLILGSGGWDEDGPKSERRNVANYGWRIGIAPASMRHYAAPLSRTGRSATSPTRLQKSAPTAVPEPSKPERRINRAIVSRTIRLIVGDDHEIVTRMEALRRAEYMDLDLVEVDCKQDPPVCKLMDFNKERFKDRQREKELKKKQSERRRLDDLKEVRFSTRTEQNDLELKAQMASRLLLKGHRVKLAVIPHGNDDLEPKGRELIERMLALLKDSSKVETGPRIEKQRAWVLIRPTPVAIQNVSKSKKERLGKVEGSNESSSSVSEDE